MKLHNLQLLMVLLFAVFFAACGGNEQKSGNNEKDKEKTKDKVPAEIKRLDSSAMAVHDTVMAEMNRLRILKDELKQKLKKTKNEAQAEEYERAVHNLKRAEDMMYEWMDRKKQYNQIADTLAYKVRKLKADSIYQKAETMKKHWNQAMKKAEELITEGKNTIQ